MGRNDEIGQLKPIECNYAGCNKRFDTEKEMKYHKVADPTHFYCNKCNVDCEDDEELKLHKIAAMEPWLSGDMKHHKDDSPKHIVCEFCGMDFKSFAGRKIHREKSHPADQHIECPGCLAVFVRAGHLLAHFENGKCSKITRRKFLESVQHKHVLREIDGHGRDLLDNLEMYEDSKNAKRLAQDTEEGGVNLLDTEDAHQDRGLKPLQAEVPLLESTERAQLTPAPFEKWTPLPSQHPACLSESLRKLSMAPSATESGSGGVSIDGSHLSLNESTSQNTSRRGSIKVRTESSPSINSPTNAFSMSEDDDKISEASTTRAISTSRSTAWTTGSTSQALFKGAKPTPPLSGGWDQVLEKREEEARTLNTTSLLQVRFWDPTSEDFDKERFLCWNEAIEEYEYRCPFTGCEDVAYDVEVDLIGHFQYAHLKRHYTCPLCLKRFKFGHGLIAHSESNGKCKVKQSSKYDQLLDEVSGGFLRAEHLQAPKIAKGKDGERREGIMSTKYIAQMPGEKVNVQ